MRDVGPGPGIRGPRVRMRAACLCVPAQVYFVPRFLVTGGPGTGKTMLARDMMRRLETQGKCPLFLCSTRALAAGLRADGLVQAWASSAPGSS